MGTVCTLAKYLINIRSNSYGEKSTVCLHIWVPSNRLLFMYSEYRHMEVCAFFKLLYYVCRVFGYVLAP